LIDKYLFKRCLSQTAEGGLSPPVQPIRHYIRLCNAQSLLRKVSWARWPPCSARYFCLS